MKRKLVLITMVLLMMLGLVSCTGTKSAFNDLKGNITGNTYECQFYTNTGSLSMTATGTNIGLSENVVKERTYNDSDGFGYTETLSSVVTITIDGHQIETCGDTVLFIESGLTPDINFTIQDINSKADSFSDNVFIASSLNAYKNYFGKPVVAVIKSQLGDPIVAYSGNNVYWEVCQDLPKTTKLYIDGHALYIHRANFQIIDAALLK